MSALLELEQVRGGYGRTPVLFGIDLALDEGEVLAFVGRNGMGKSTTIRTILGLCRATGGRIAMSGRDITAAPSHRIARSGIAWVPEGRAIFPTLSVRENLLATAANYGALATPWSLGDVYALFPRLRERCNQSGSALSGGESQMLAIGRALMLGPRVLLFDEATEGLAPLIRDEIWACVRLLRERGTAILIVDKNLAALTAITDRVAVIEKGVIVWNGSMAMLAGDHGLQQRYLVV